MTKVKTLTRSDIADAITAEFQVTKFEALEFIHEVLSEISEALVDGEDVKLTGFGTFKVHNKKERMGRNPKTKEPAIISARRTVSFRASPILKKKVNEDL
ncbi:MAG: integration host factor subunit alpha [Alphaproteobacteria bacterium]|nr:integration host factor subunit alpha [Alphaproteobacteria bacterium]